MSSANLIPLKGVENFSELRGLIVAAFIEVIIKL
jgi:hypothetical protein